VKEREKINFFFRKILETPSKVDGFDTPPQVTNEEAHRIYAETQDKIAQDFEQEMDKDTFMEKLKDEVLSEMEAFEAQNGAQ
jgi:hypothetical protein